MAVCIRLTRLGTNKKPHFRLVVADKTKPRDGNFLEVLGNYDPKIKEKGLKFKKDRYDYWMSKGAKPSKRVADLVKTK